jgi:hypothetical protein
MIMKFKTSPSKTENSSMGWITVYITGEGDFRAEVLKKLEASDVNFMPGNTGASSDLDTHDLYWLDEKVDIRKFKEAIGSKLVWKYRLNFFTSLEAFIESQKNKIKHTELTPEENVLLLKMQEADYHSAS